MLPFPRESRCEFQFYLHVDTTCVRHARRMRMKTPAAGRTLFSPCFSLCGSHVSSSQLKSIWFNIAINFHMFMPAPYPPLLLIPCMHGFHCFAPRPQRNVLLWVFFEGVSAVCRVPFHQRLSSLIFSCSSRQLLTRVRPCSKQP